MSTTLLLWLVGTCLFLAGWTARIAVQQGRELAAARALAPQHRRRDRPARS